MSAPQVSILMPVRNDARTLPDCMESIVAQTLPDWELVVVDDGSDDDSPALLKSWASREARIRVFTTGPQGIVPALNTGLAECRGRFIARMDADDRMRPTRLERQVAFCEQHPDCGMIGAQVAGFTDDGSISDSTRRYQDWNNALVSHEQIRNDLFVESPIMHPTFFGPRRTFERLGGYRVQPWAEDYDLLLRTASAGLRFGKVPEVLVEKYHAHDRLSHVDPIYKRPAMFQAKVHYLLEFGYLEGRDGVLVCGAGPSGRTLAEQFQARGVPVHGFLDNRPGPPDRRLKGVPAWGFAELPPPEFWEPYRQSLICVAVGDTVGQRQLTAHLSENGFVEQHDFVRVI